MSFGTGVVVLYPLFDNLTVRSVGGGTGWNNITLALPRLERILPYAASLRVHWKSRNHSSACEWKLVFWTSFDGVDWDGPFDLMTAVAAEDQGIGTPYTTVANFGLFARYGVAVRASAGTNQEGAVASCVLDVTWKS